MLEGGRKAGLLGRPGPSLVWSTQKPYSSKSKETSVENDFCTSERRLLEYNLSKNLKVAGIYCICRSTVIKNVLKYQKQKYSRGSQI